MIYDLLIIGGGSSGISCYLKYRKKNPNKNVLIVESNNELLKKLSATGNGKCNFTNLNLNHSKYNNGEYFKDLLDNNLNKILDWFKELGIEYFSDIEGRFYPYSNSAKTVKYIMESNINKDDYILNQKVTNIIKNNYIFTVEALDNTNNTQYSYKARNVLVSTGLKNYSSLGSDFSIEKVLTNLGHSFTDIYPSNIYVKIKNKNITKPISGLRIKAKASLYNDNELIFNELGEVLFKDDALSGIVIFNLSSSIAYLYKNKLDKHLTIHLDLVPDIDNLKINNNDYKKEYLKYLDYRIVDCFTKNNITNIKDVVFDVSGLGDFMNAQVSCGGIKIDEINTKSLESKIVKNLYFSGDILDIDAPCGGYNLSNAFLSGMKVGEEVE